MRLLLKKRSDFPKCIRHFKELKGICIGGCVYTDNDYYRKAVLDHWDIGPGHSMHAHDATGWICMRYKCQLKDKMVLLHEVAHLLAGEVGKLNHGKKWKQIVVAIGGSFKKLYSYDGKYEYQDYTYRNY